MDYYYNISLNFEPGKFGIKELRPTNEECIELCHDEYDILSYDEPRYGSEVRLYSIPRESLTNALTALYDGNGELERIEITCGNETRLVYIRYIDTEYSKSSVMEFIKAQADKISDEILKRKNISRLFIEYFYDGEAVDLTAKTGTAAEMQAVIDKYSGDIETADNSGNYPFDNRIECDNEAFRVMLLCTEADYRNTLFRLSVSAMEEHIKERVLDKIDKTKDFRFISEEYD